MPIQIVLLINTKKKVSNGILYFVRPGNNELGNNFCLSNESVRDLQRCVSVRDGIGRLEITQSCTMVEYKNKQKKMGAEKRKAIYGVRVLETIFEWDIFFDDVWAAAHASLRPEYPGSELCVCPFVRRI